MTGNVPINFMDNPHAPEVFSTSCSGYLLANGCVHLTFESVRIDHTTSPGPVNRVVIGRIVMPLRAAQELVLGLHDYLAKQGLDPTQAIKGSETAQ